MPGARVQLPIVPASFFGIVLGVAGLGAAWRQAHAAWGVPAIVGEALMGVATAVWAALVLLYAAKWVSARAAALSEARHPVQCCFVGLVGVATLLIAGAVLPYSRLAAQSLFVIGAVYTLVFAVWRTGVLWQGGRDECTSTPVLYLPTVAGGFVTATTASALGRPDWGALAFGAAVFSWLAIESVLLHRLYMAPALPPALRPTLGIQLAPPTVGAVAYLSVSGGDSGLLTQAMLGYGLFQAVLLLRLLPWVHEQHASAAYWAFSFGATSIATASILMVRHGATAAVVEIAPVLFIGSNILIALLAASTVWLMAKGRLLPRQPPPTDSEAPLSARV